MLDTLAWVGFVCLAYATFNVVDVFGPFCVEVTLITVLSDAADTNLNSSPGAFCLANELDFEEYSAQELHGYNDHVQ